MWIKIQYLRFKGNVEKYPVYPSDIKKAIKTISAHIQDIEIEDDSYLTCDQETAKFVVKTLFGATVAIRRVLSLLGISRFVYKKSFDCDNFSRMFWAIGTFIFTRLPIARLKVETSKGLHSLNGIFYRNVAGRIAFTYIEPQVGKMAFFNYKLLKLTI